MNEIKAFTLVELLVVVAIVGILAALGLANFAEYKKHAYDAGARVMAVDLLTVTEAWLTSEWDGETDQEHNWVHWGNGADTFVGSGAQFMEYYTAVNDDYTFIARIDTGCYVGAPCVNGIVRYGFAAHCPSAEGGLVRRYSRIEREGGATVWEETTYSAAFYQC